MEDGDIARERALPGFIEREGGPRGDRLAETMGRTLEFADEETIRERLQPGADVADFSDGSLRGHGAGNHKRDRSGACHCAEEL